MKTIKVNGLLLLGTDRYVIPGLAIVGAAGIMIFAGYGVYRTIANVIEKDTQF